VESNHRQAAHPCNGIAWVIKEIDNGIRGKETVHSSGNRSFQRLGAVMDMAGENLR